FECQLGIERARKIAVVVIAARGTESELARQGHEQLAVDGMHSSTGIGESRRVVQSVSLEILLARERTDCKTNVARCELGDFTVGADLERLRVASEIDRRTYCGAEVVDVSCISLASELRRDIQLPLSRQPHRCANV